MYTSQSFYILTGIKALPRTASNQPCVRGIVVWALGLGQLVWLFKQPSWYCPICTLWRSLALIKFFPGKRLRENSPAQEKSIRRAITEKSSWDRSAGQESGAPGGVHRGRRACQVLSATGPVTRSLCICESGWAHMGIVPLSKDRQGSDMLIYSNWVFTIEEAFD